ncbi:hypothetical protein LOTGIDRAFT_134810 [Lottia gigantea]|uniref:Short-chain collagen C4-like n=1 Tax=Lottia gigantea TaxID=225164 RepID=V3ZE79_LOTGI|nr:hypothetical protein LOTGIDRAFT_134810 [Lottia gigantea]ESO82352.1 hypothetical protein LOTGIDRAFT_134810 [Lottia gigantea]
MWNINKHYNGPYWGYMYGAEYEDATKPLHHYEVPCAVCRSSQFSTVLMIPARSECYQGWQKAYHGELVSGYYKHNAASQYICLDDNPQTNGTNAIKYGKLTFPVRAQCGSLPCPPYEHNTLLTCVVCLK